MSESARTIRLYDPDQLPGPEPPAIQGVAARDDGGMDVREIVSAYLADAEIRHAAGEFSKASLTACRRDLTRFATMFGHKKMAECRNGDLTDFLFDKTKPWGNATRRRVLAEILACFSWAADDGALVERSPYRRPKRLKLPVKPRREARQDEYVVLMHNGCRALRRILFFLRRCGCRPQEARMAKWTDVRWEDRVVVLMDHKTFKATGKPRVFGLEPCVFRLLRNLYRQARDKGGNIFLNLRGKPWTEGALWQHVKRLLVRLGIDPGKGLRITPYQFRHSWATNAIEAGIGERQVADQMGHSSTSLIGWYSKAGAKYQHLRGVAEAAAKRKK